MKTTISLLVLTVFLYGGLCATEPEKPKGKTQLLFNVWIFKGDPQGSKQDGTKKVIAEPTLVTTENHPCTFLAPLLFPETRQTVDGDRIVLGDICKCWPGAVENGKLPLTIEFTNTKIRRETADEIEFSSRTKYTKMKVKLGEATTYQFSEPDAPADRLNWIEFTVTEIPLLEDR